jgi:AraC-like DNA-binding protein
MGRYPTFQVADYVDVLRHIYQWPLERIARHTGVEKEILRSKTLARYPNDKAVLKLIQTLDELDYFGEKELSFGNHRYRQTLKLPPPVTAVRLIIAEMYNAQTVEEFSQCVVRRFNSLSEATKLWLEHSGGAIRICHQYYYEEENFGGPQRTFVFFVRHLKEIFGLDESALKVTFFKHGIRDARGFVKLTGCPITSEGNFSSVEIASGYQKYVNKASSPVAQIAIGEALDDLLEPHEIDFVATVESLLERNLAELRRSLDIEATASQLGMSRATLHRRLAEAGVSFRELRSRSRLAYAAYLLRTTVRDIASISTILGYSESSAFCRAFKAQHDCSPNEYRSHTIAIS